MKYNDFPILSNTDYTLISAQYSNLLAFNRDNTLLDLCNEIYVCLGYCNTLKNTFNKTTTDQIKKSNDILTKLLNNISSQFNIKLAPKQTITNFNLFSFMKQINKILLIIFNWFINEQKEYYKTIAKRSFYELIEIKNNILSALEKSQVTFYKFM